MDDLQTYLTREGVAGRIVDLGVPMPTAALAAEQLKVPVGKIFKSLVLTNEKGEGYVVVVMTGDARIDMKAVAGRMGWKRVRFASAEAVLRETGYPAGGTPPVGHRNKLPVIVDEGVLAHDVGYGGGGRHELMMEITPAEIVRATGAVVARVSAGGEATAA